MPDVEPKPEILTQHSDEYSQVCEHYRQGFRLVIDVCRLYMIFQAGLAAAFSFLVTHPEVEQSIPISAHISVKLTVLILSLIGILTGPGAWLVARRFFQYYRCGMKRAVEIEAMYGMSLMTSLDVVWDTGKKFEKSINVALTLFVLVAAFWLVGVWQSFVFH